MEFIQNFKNFLLLQKPAPSQVTVKNYVADVKHFIAWYESFLSKPFQPSEVTLPLINQFRSQKTATYSVRSIERHISSLRKFFHALKLQGTITRSPFDEIPAGAPRANQDPWRLKEFKDFLYVYNASRLTIKNYIIDVKQFLKWVEEISDAEDAARINEKNVFGYISNSLLEEYKQRLLETGTFSATSINRKLSSLRKYLSWAGAQGYLSTQIAIPDNLNNSTNSISTDEVILPKIDINTYQNESTTPNAHEKEEKVFVYSKFPPLRLMQRVGRIADVAVEAVIITPLTKAVILVHKQVWKLQGKKLFVQDSRLAQGLPQPRFTPYVENIKKAIYAPHAISLKYFPWYKKAIHHARYTRPDWYRKYHTYALAHYFNWAILIVFCTAIGFGMYNSFIAKPTDKPTLAASAPPRILSFQGRLTDSADSPITASTNLRFAIYSDATSSGSALLWQEVNGVVPDKNGVFSVLLGKGTTIPQSLFANNQNLYLGVSVGTTTELTPRQQLATVAYASNAETLQGLPPITQSGAGTTNVILALNSSGNLSVGASTTFQSTTGQFAIAGNTVALSTNPGSNGNITLTPDGSGVIDLQKPLQNSSLSNNVAPGLGALEVDDLFAVLATSAASAVIVNQNGSGALFTASTAGVTKFTVGNAGDITSANYTTNGGVLYTNGTGLFLQTSAGALGDCLTSNGGGAPTWGTCGGGTNYWNLTNGTLSPINSTLDVFFGGTATNSANFAFINNAGGTPTASIAGNLTLNSAGVIQTTRNQALTIGGNTTGNIILSPLNGTGNVTIGGLTAGVVHSNNSGVLSATALNLAGGATEVSGVLPLANGGTNNSLTADNGGILYSDASKVQILAHSPTVGTCLVSGGSGAPTWGNCTGGGGLNWWNMNLGTIFPVNTTLDFVVGGTGTSSAKFAFINVASGTPTASISGNVTLNSAGVIQTTNNQALTLGGNSTGNIILSPLNGTGNVTINGKINNSLTPTVTDTYDLGTAALEWNNLYVKNITATGNFSGFFQRFLGVISPTNSTDDFAVGGTATGSAKFQISGTTGNATTSGNLTFDGTGNLIQTTRNQGLTIGGSTTGNITLSPLNGTGNVTINGTVASNLIPSTTNTYDLGSSSQQWNNLYANTIFQNGQPVIAAWQRNAGVLSPLQVTNDLAIGGSATGSALFQVFANTGNATMGGTLTLNSVGSLQTTNNQGLTIGGNTTGNITLAPLNGTGNVTISGLGTGVVHSTAGVLSTTTVALTSEVSGILPIANGGTNTNTIGSAGRVVYSNGTSYAFTAVGSTGDCLVSNGSSSPVWGSCSAAAGATNYWTQDNGLGLLYPNLSTLDVLFGGTSSSSANFAFLNNAPGSGTPTASISGNITLNSAGVIQTTKNQALTLGGNSTGNIILSPLNGTGSVTINGNQLITTASNFDLLNTTATTVNFAGAATTLTIGNASTGTTLNGSLTLTGTANLNGDVALGNATADTITANGRFGSDLVPTTTDTYNLGTAALEWNNLYVKNIISTGNTAGFFQRNLGVLSPSDITDDLAIGGTATGSAKFQIFGNTGNATTAGTLTFDATGSLIQTTKNQGLTIGGTTTGNITLSPLNGNGTVTINGNKLITTASSFDLLNTAATTINFGGAATAVNIGAATGTTTVNNALTVTGNATLNGDVALGNATADTITATGRFGSSLIPTTTDTYDLGSNSLEWNNLYVKNIISGGSISGFWQRFLGVVSPTNITDDLAIGGTATGSAKFQIFSSTGNATTAGTLTFNGNGTLQTTNNQPLTLGGTTTGGIILSPNNGTGSVTVNGKFASSLIPSITDTYDLGSNSLEWNNLYVKNIISGGTLAGFFQRNLGLIAPANIADDFAVGGGSTSSAKFQIFGLTGNATTAGTLTFTNGTSQIQTTSNLPLTLGGTTTGGIILSPNNGTGTVTINGLGTGIVHSTSGVLSSANVSLTSEVTGVLPLANGGTSNNLTADAGGIVYSDASKLQILAHSASSGQCLLSGGTGTPTWGDCTLGGGSNWWSVNAGSLYPINSTLDFFVGGSATNSAKFAVTNMASGTPVASVSSGLNGNGISIAADGTLQTTNNQGLTLGGSTTGNITLSPLGGTGTVTVNGNKLLTTASSFDLLNTTATTINFGGAADVNISTAGKTTTANGNLTVVGITNLNGTVNLGDATADTIVANGRFASDLMPLTNNTYNLGSSSLEWNNVFANNIFTNGNYAGFFQRFLGVVSPTNITDDLAIGGTATGSAKFQIFGNTGNATTAGNLTFSNAGSIQTTKNQPLTLGGTSTGNIILSPNSGTGSITVNGTVNSNFIPTATDTYDLGSASFEWNNLYVKNIVTGGTILGTWQRNLGVLAPLNITDDLAIGGNATSSAKFQVIGLTGNATTAGTLTFTNGTSQIQTTSNLPLTLGGTTTGGIILSPNNGTGTVTINGNKLITTASNFDLLNTTATAINFGGAATALSIGAGTGTTTVNNALTVTGVFTANNNVVLGNTSSNTINPVGVFSGSLIPQSTSVNLGSNTNFFGSAFITNLFASATSNYQGFLQRFLGVVSPTNITDDLAIGGTATGSAKFQIFGNTGNATTAGNLTFNGNGVIQTTNNLPLTLGGNATGNIILSPNNGTGAITINGKFNSSLIPTVTNTYDLGSASLQWNTVYANSVIVNGQSLTQDWQRNLGVLSPLNIADDVAVGGTATGSAKFQIFGLTGNATTAGNLTFTGGSASNVIATRNNQGLTIGDSQTGNITISALNGGAGSTINLNAATIATNQTTLNLFNGTPTTINFGGAATTANLVTAATTLHLADGGTTTTLSIGGSAGTTTVNNALTVTGNATLNGDVALGNATADTITATGRFGSSLIPTTTDTYDLGSSSLEWNNLYAKNIFATGNYSGFWQRFAGVVSPTNISDDLAIGGSATSSAKFQIFANTGNATTAGTLTFNGNGNLIQTTNNQPLTIGGNTTGAVTVSANNGTGTLSLAAATVALTGTTPTVTTLSNNALSILAGTGTITLGTNATGGDIQFFNSSNKITNAGALTIASNLTVNGTGVSFIAGRLGIGVSPATGTALDVEKDSLGNAGAIFANLNLAGDLVTASNSAATQFVVTNGGVVKARSFQDLDNSSYLLDPASTGNSLLINGTAGIGTLNPLSSSGLDIEKNALGNAALVVANLNLAGDLFTASNSAGTKFTIANNGTISKTGYTTSGGLLFTNGTGVVNQTAAGNLGECLTSAAGGTPVWAACSTGSSGTNYWTMSNGALYPINSTFDMFAGGNSTASAKFAVLNMASGTPVASVSSGLNGTALFMSADGSIQTATENTLTLGGNRTGNIDLTPQNGLGKVTVNGVALDGNSAGFTLLATPTTLTFGGSASTLTIGATTGTTTFRTPAIDDNAATVTLFGTPTSLTFGGAATTLNIGKSGGTTTVLSDAAINGNTTLGTNASNTITSNGLYSTDIVPTGNGSVNLGSSLHYYNTVYANNFVAPVGSGTAGYWAVSNDVLFPVNTFYDLTVGGTATGSATPWQVFSQTLGVDTAGTATSSAGLSFRGTTTNVDLLNGSVLKVNTSVGGDEGLAGHTQIQLDNNGDLTLGGANIKTTQGTVALFDTTATTLNIGGSATTGINLGNAIGATLLRGNLTLGSSNTNTIFPNGKFSASIVPTSTSINLGGSSNYFGSVYATNIFMASNAQYSGFWQINNKVLSPVDVGNYDLAIGGTATSSAKFQIFAASGTASTSGNLTFQGTNPTVLLANGQPLIFNFSPGGGTGTNYITFGKGGSIISEKSGGSFYADSWTTGGNGGAEYTGNWNSSGLWGLGTISNSGDNTIRIGNINQDNGTNIGPTGTWSGTQNLILNLPGQLTLGGSFAPLNQTALDVEKNSLGNATAIVNQLGAGDIFTASGSGLTKFTIANDGTIKNSIIPFATDTYNLGSDPTLGGKEWDTLYVRQIVTPANGGLAGFWQLSNGGVLAPANTTNDLVIGGNATASARFQVFGSGVNVGTITMKPNDPQVNNNAGTLPASSKIINIASADHTYMTLDNKDLTIGGHKSMQSISNVQKVIIYDTSKDSDGGRWTNDERAQASSWYNETATAADTCSLSSNTRCGQQAFPRKAIIVVTTGTTGSLYIFDAKDNSLWMRFDKGATTTENMVGPTTNDTASSVAALNGKIYVATGGFSGTAGALYVVDFTKDISYKFNDSGYSVGSNTIQNRNAQDNYSLYNNVYGTLSPAGFENRFIDVAVNVINGQTYIAGGSRSGVVVYNESAQTEVATFDTVGIASNVALTSTGDLYATMCIDGSNPCGHYVLKVKHNVQNTSFGTNKTFDEVYGYNSSSNYGATTTDNNTFSSITFTAGPSATTSANFVPPVANGLAVTQGTSTIDGTSNTIYLAAGGSSGALAVIQEKKGDPSNGSIKYYNSNYITEDMVGDIRGMWPFNETSGNLLDSSVRGITLTASSSGVTYSASGVRGNALTFNGTSGFVYCTNSNCGGTSDLGIDGTQKRITVGAWVKTSASGARQVIVSKWNNNVGGSYLLTVESTGKVMWALNGLTSNVTSVRTVNDGNWHHVVGTYDGAYQNLYIDGQLDGQQAKTLAFSSSTIDFLIGAYLANNNYAGWFNGSIDEPFVAADTLTSAEIAHMYQVGYRAVQNHSSKTIRGVVTGSDSNQKLINGNSNVSAVAANMQNGQIYIGTQGGGTSVIGMDSDTLTDMYSSSINTTGDAGTAWSASANNNFVQTIATGQSYGNGTALVIGNSNSGTGNTWMETQDTSLKEVLASSYNPFGSSLTQSNLSVDSVLRVTNQLSTRLDNTAFGATSSAQFADAFRVDSNGNLLSRSLVNSTDAMQFQNAAGNSLLTIDTTGNNQAFQFLQPGSGDIMIASSSAGTQLQLTNSGILRARQFQDLDSTSYFLDPAASSIALAISGSESIGPTASQSASVKLIVQGTSNNAGIDAVQIRDNTQSGYGFMEYVSTGVTTPFFQLGAWNLMTNGYTNTIIPGGNVGIGTNGPGAKLEIYTTTTTGSELNLNTSGSAAQAAITFEAASSGKWQLGNDTDNSFFLWDNVAGRADIRISSNSNMTLMPAGGNVGIGTTGAGNRLEVEGGAISVGTSTASDGVTVNGLPGTGFGQFRMIDGNYGSFFRNDGSNTYLLLTNSLDQYGSWNSLRPFAVNDATGNVGIGIAPSQQLTVHATNNGGKIASIGNFTTTNSTSVGVLELRLGATGSNSRFIQFYSGSTSDTNGTGQGSVILTTGGVQYNTTVADFGEYFDLTDDATFGDIVSDYNDGNKKATESATPLIGVVSNTAGFVGNATQLATSSATYHDTNARSEVVGLLGQVMTHLSTINGAIKKGDYITASSIPGYGQKSTKAEQIVGRAMTDFDPANGVGTATPCPDGTPNGIYCGKVLVYVNVGYHDSDTELADDSSFQLLTQQVTQNGQTTTLYSLAKTTGEMINRIGGFSKLVVAQMTAGLINTQQIFTNSLAIATANVTIAGQSLHDYILSVVQSAGYTSGSLASSNTVKTNIISPLNGGNVALRLTNSGIEVAKDASSSAVAGIDNNGNATFSGSLNSQNLAVNGDASVSGTLRAGRIEANTIAGLQAIVGTLSAQTITNVTNIYFATASATQNSTNTIIGSNTISGTASGALTPQMGYANIASYSGFLAYVPNLSAATGTFSQNLTSSGTTSLSDTTINGQLAIGTQLILADNAINVLGSTFQIQSLQQGNVSFEGGLVAIDTNGNLTVNGNAVFANNLAANVISPLSNDKDLTFRLGETGASGSAIATSTLAVQNASGSGIFNIDQLGNVIASGAASIAKLNFTAVQPALAVSNTEIVATGSAGTAAIKSNQTEVTIDNPLVTAKSLIYITPVGQTNYTPYLLRQVGGKSFTVGIPVQQYLDTTFNWLIVN